MLIKLSILLLSFISIVSSQNHRPFSATKFELSPDLPFEEPVQVSAQLDAKPKEPEPPKPPKKHHETQPVEAVPTVPPEAPKPAAGQEATSQPPQPQTLVPLRTLAPIAPGLVSVTPPTLAPFTPFTLATIQPFIPPQQPQIGQQPQFPGQQIGQQPFVPPPQFPAQQFQGQQIGQGQFQGQQFLGQQYGPGAGQRGQGFQGQIVQNQGFQGQQFNGQQFNGQGQQFQGQNQVGQAQFNQGPQNQVNQPNPLNQGGRPQNPSQRESTVQLIHEAKISQRVDLWFRENYDLSICKKDSRFLANEFRLKFPSNLWRDGKESLLADLLAARLNDCFTKQESNHWRRVDGLISGLNLAATEEEECRTGLIQEQISCDNVFSYTCQFIQKAYNFRLVPTRLIIQEARIAEDGAEKCRKIVRKIKKDLQG